MILRSLVPQHERCRNKKKTFRFICREIVSSFFILCIDFSLFFLFFCSFFYKRSTKKQQLYWTYFHEKIPVKSICDSLFVAMNFQFRLRNVDQVQGNGIVLCLYVFGSTFFPYCKRNSLENSLDQIEMKEMKSTNNAD